MTWGAIAGTVISTGVGAGMSASSANSSKGAARRAAQAQLAGNISAANILNSGTKKATKRLDPYAALGNKSADALTGMMFGSPDMIFAEPMVLPVAPKRKDFGSQKEFLAAKKAYQQEYDQVRANAAAKGINIPARDSFKSQVYESDGKGGVNSTDNADYAKRDKWVEDWNLKQAALKTERDKLAAQGITTPEQYQASLDKSGQFGPGGLMRNYTMDQFNAENGTNLDMNSLLTPYTQEKYQQEWGVDPKSLLQPGNFEASPDYQFRKDQGMAGIESSAAARGGLLSGATLKALNTYNSNLASGEYGNWYNRDAQNRQFGLNNFWTANAKDNQDRGMQYGAFTDAFGRNQTNKTTAYNMLKGTMAAGQDAATNQAQFDFNGAGGIANIVSNQGKDSANAQLAQGAINANQQQGFLQALTQGINGIAGAAGDYFGGGTGTGGGTGNISAVNTGTNSNAAALPTGWDDNNFASLSSLFGSKKYG